MSVLMFMHMAMGIHYHWYGMMEIVAGGIAIFWGGRNAPRSMDSSCTRSHLNMDTLIAISAVASWVTALMYYFGLDILLRYNRVMILMLHSTGRYIESHLRDRAAKQVKALMTLQPREAPCRL